MLSSKSFLSASTPMYPYSPPFSATLLQTIERAIVFAWKKLRDNRSVALTDEVVVTTGLVAVMNEMLSGNTDVPGFSFDQFETVVKGPELCNYNGKHLEKRPDMVIRRVGRPPVNCHKSYWGLFVECKLVDATHPVARYGSEGITRFVCGDYAWAVDRALMLGYASPSMTLPPTLKSHLDRKASGVPIGKRYEMKNSTSAMSKSARLVESVTVCETVHGRAWAHMDSSTPGDIVIAHMWLQ